MSPDPGNRVRLFSLTEVLAVFALMHLAMRALKQLTALGGAERAAGLNFTSGIVMGLIALGCIVLHGSRWADHGLGRPAHRWWRPRPWLLLSLYGLPMAAFLRWEGAAPLTGALVFLGHVSTTAIGEELFFRGYIQTRLNEAFGPARSTATGAPFGVGFWVTALLFGLLHGLNTVDYFRGSYAFAWGWAASATATGVLYGYLREKSGSLLPSILVHGLLNVWILAASLLLRS